MAQAGKTIQKSPSSFLSSLGQYFETAGRLGQNANMGNHETGVGECVRGKKISFFLSSSYKIEYLMFIIHFL